MFKKIWKSLVRNTLLPYYSRIFIYLYLAHPHEFNSFYKYMWPGFVNPLRNYFCEIWSTSGVYDRSFISSVIGLKLAYPTAKDNVGIMPTFPMPPNYYRLKALTTVFISNMLPLALCDSFLLHTYVIFTTWLGTNGNNNQRELSYKISSKTYINENYLKTEALFNINLIQFIIFHLIYISHFTL